MRIWIEGNTETNQFLRKKCTEAGMVLSSPTACDLAVLQFPYSAVSEELKQAFPDEQRIVCGMITEETNCMAKEKNWRLFQPLKDEIYLSENAKLTAEGAVSIAMNKMTIAVCDAVCTVIGYGRIGKELTHILRSLGAEVIVAARRKESREEAGEKSSVSINRIQSVLSRSDLILNTVPSPILSESGLFHIKNTAFLIELASRPYGFDMQQAKKLGLHASLESGIPGRYCPQSAAAALYRYIERSVQLE